MQEAFEAIRTRLRQPLGWFPLPALVVSGLALILGGHLLMQLNPRLGEAIDILTFAAPETANPTIYITMRPDNNEMVITLNNRAEYRTSLKDITDESLVSFNDDLRQQVNKTTIASARAGVLPDLTSNVIIAVDQKLAYYHIRPIINSLAKTGITNYGFETLAPVANEATSRE